MGRFLSLIPKLERTKDADEYRAKLYRARCRLLTVIIEKKERNSSVSCCLIKSTGI